MNSSLAPPVVPQTRHAETGSPRSCVLIARDSADLAPSIWVRTMTGSARQRVKIRSLMTWLGGYGAAAVAGAISPDDAVLLIAGSVIAAYLSARYLTARLESLQRWSQRQALAVRLLLAAVFSSCASASYLLWDMPYPRREVAMSRKMGAK